MHKAILSGLFVGYTLTAIAAIVIGGNSGMKEGALEAFYMSKKHTASA